MTGFRKCIYKDNECNEKCIAYSKSEEYPTPCKIVNSLMTIANRMDKISKRGG